MSTVKFFCETLKLLSRISGRIPDIPQNKFAGYPAAGYPANSVSGATLDNKDNKKEIEIKIKRYTYQPLDLFYNDQQRHGERYIDRDSNKDKKKEIKIKRYICQPSEPET